MEVFAWSLQTAICWAKRAAARHRSLRAQCSRFLYEADDTCSRQNIGVVVSNRCRHGITCLRRSCVSSGFYSQIKKETGEFDWLLLILCSSANARSCHIFHCGKSTFLHMHTQWPDRRADLHHSALLHTCRIALIGYVKLFKQHFGVLFQGKVEYLVKWKGYSER